MSREDVTAFQGFGADTVRYLSDLAADNDRGWFEAHRRDYETLYVAPAVAFVEALRQPLEDLDPALAVEPKVNGSVFRINRDTRFSKDKAPYKPHIDFWFWVGARKAPVSALFMRLGPATLILGTGVHGFDPPRLARFREAVVDADADFALAKAAKAVETAGHEVMGAHYKALPRGLSAPTPAAERFLRHNGLYALYERPHPPTLGSPAFTGTCLAVWRSCLPIHRWLSVLG